MKTADYRGILYNFNNDLFKNNRELPNALSYAIDRQAIIDSVLLGEGQLAYSPLQAGPYNNPDIEKFILIVWRCQVEHILHNGVGIAHRGGGRPLHGALDLGPAQVVVQRTDTAQGLKQDVPLHIYDVDALVGAVCIMLEPGDVAGLDVAGHQVLDNILAVAFQVALGGFIVGVFEDHIGENA